MGRCITLKPLERPIAALVISMSLLVAGANVLYAGGHRTYQCSTSEHVREALKVVGPGDTIMLQGGRVYEIDKSFVLDANGSDSSRINFTSQDGTGQGRHAVISTVGQKKEKDLVAFYNTFY